MSYSSVLLCANDSDLQGRIQVAQQKEAIYNPNVANPQAVIDSPGRWINQVIWPLSFTREAEYESALAGNVDRPGNDPSVISDGDILSAVLAYWPGGVSTPPEGPV